MNRYNADAGHFEATRLALREIADIFEQYEGAVLVGGFVPFILIPQDNEPHEGTIDVDIAIDPNKLRTDGEWTLHEILSRRLFQQHEKKPFKWYKSYAVGERYYKILLELLSGGGSTPTGLREVKKEDIYTSVIEGIEVALVNPVDAVVEDWTIKVASIGAFLTMKSVALERRPENKNQKDASDIVYCLRNYPDGLKTLSHIVRPEMAHPLVAEGMQRLASQFRDTRSPGPVAYARSADPDNIGLLKREAVERVGDLVTLLGIKTQ